MSIDQKSLKDLFKKMEEINPFSSSLAENRLSNVEPDEWLDSGCAAFNLSISGHPERGIPKGRIAIFAGESQSGKTFILNRLIKDSLSKGMQPIIFDSEHDKSSDMMTNMGIDPFAVRSNPVLSLEDLGKQVYAVLNWIKERKDMWGKFFLAVDSLGALASLKQVSDYEKNKDANDMGLNAKVINNMIKIWTPVAAITKTPIVVINHVYDDPAAFMPSKVKKMPGGKKLYYLASISVQFSASKELDEKQESSSDSVKYNGTVLKFFVIKNRFMVPYVEGQAYLNFKTGLERYSGLIDTAEANNVVFKEGRTYFLSDTKEKLGQYNDFKNSDEIWSKILPKLTDIIQKKYAYMKETQSFIEEPEFDDETSPQTEE